MLTFVFCILSLIANWQLFKKMGRQGWEGIIPFYNAYVLFELVEGNGWKMLWLFVPLANIYWIFKLYLDLAHEFHQGTGFGLGLVFLNAVFCFILAFGNYQFRDGSYANNSEDFFSTASERFSESAANFTNTMTSTMKKDDRAIEKIKQLEELRQHGLISEEEFYIKKSELLKMI